MKERGYFLTPTINRSSYLISQHLGRELSVQILLLCEMIQMIQTVRVVTVWSRQAGHRRNVLM